MNLINRLNKEFTETIKMQIWQTKKIQKNNLNAIYFVKKSLDFLSSNDKIINILLVNKEWENNLRKKIYKIYLKELSLKNIDKRAQIWISFLKINSVIKFFFN